MFFSSSVLFFLACLFSSLNEFLTKTEPLNQNRIVSNFESAFNYRYVYDLTPVVVVAVVFFCVWFMMYAMTIFVFLVNSPFNILTLVCLPFFTCIKLFFTLQCIRLMITYFSIGSVN